MSVANKDEAFKCLAIAKKNLAKGDGERARHFGEKAKTLFPCPEVDTFLRSLDATGPNTTRSGSKPSTQPAAASSSTPSSSSAPRNGNTATPAQREMVSRIRAAKGDFYRVLGVERSADDDDIKKAYRKLALKLHPDKCQAPGAEEAFKEVSKAFTCLADSQKRAFYDRTGHEDSSAAAAAQAQRRGGMGPGMQFQGDISPEDLFNMMFGGGMGGFGMGPMHFGGFRGHPQFHQRRHPQQQEGHQQQQDPRQRFGGLLNILGPLLLLLLALFSNSGAPPASLHFSRTYPVQVYTQWNSVPFYVKDKGVFLREYPNNSIKRQNFEHMIEQEWRQETQQQCNYERMKEREVQKRARSRNRSAPPPTVNKPSCDKLRDFHRSKQSDDRSRENSGSSYREVHEDF